MLLDLLDDQFPSELLADVCIIGGGPAGIALALELATTKLKVCLLESGGLEYEPESQSLYEGDDLGVPCELTSGRLRMFGGASNHWTGRCGRLDASDFEKRSWIRYSGWPITRDELDPYYLKAWKFCGFETGYPSERRIAAKLASKSLELEYGGIAPFSWQFAWQEPEIGRNFARTNIKSISENLSVDLVIHANVVKFIISPNRMKCNGVVVKSLKGTFTTVRATTFVLCCGGIENARILLIGDGAHAVGNDYDNVGRFFMQHPRARSAVITNPSKAIVDCLSFDLFSDKLATLAPVQLGLTLKSEFNHSKALLGCDATFEYVKNTSKGMVAATQLFRELKKGYWPSRTGDMYLSLVSDLAEIYRIAREISRESLNGGNLHLPGSIDIDVDLEQNPDRDSRITLGAKIDKLGMPKVVTNWRIGDLERKTVSVFIEQIAVAVQQQHGGRVRAEPWLIDERLPHQFSSTYHYIGTTRMSDCPRNGVVDANCRVHGLQNLYVAGSSVFPTSGHVNPTLTILALAFKLADHIKSL